MAKTAAPSRPNLPLAWAAGPILAALARYHYLTAAQVCRLLYSPGSLNYVRAALKQLADAGFVQRLTPPHTNRYGSAPLLFTLARRGLTWLCQQAGVAVPTRFRPSEVNARGYLHLTHLAALNDLLIGLELLCRADDDVHLTQVFHDRELKLNPIRVTYPDRSHHTVVPDAYVDLQVERDRVCLAFELDRGTVERDKWRRKINGYVGAITTGSYLQRFQTDILTVCVVTTAGPRRLDDLVAWTERELTALHQEREADLFRLTAFDPASTPPAQAFQAPTWRRPFQAETEVLL